LDACFVVTDSAGQKLAYVYFEDESKDEATHHGQRGEVSRICSGTNAALNLRGALLDMIYQAKAGRQFQPPSPPPRPKALTPSA
jgi:hypothetical protein